MWHIVAEPRKHLFCIRVKTIFPDYRLNWLRQGATNCHATICPIAKRCSTSQNSPHRKALVKEVEMKQEQLFLLGLLTLGAGAVVAEEIRSLDVISVTANREAKTLAETAASVGVIDSEDVELRNPGHAAELLNHIPGVNIVQLGSSGQGTVAQIRQPISYGPRYLYLENGIPTRSAGFFNHNALYEVNIGTADGAEVFKGPGSALYGSEAVGGIINILSGQKPEYDLLQIGVEAGQFDWYRTQVRSQKVTEKGGFTADVDVVSSAGWRENTEFDKAAFTTSWHTKVGDDVRISTLFTGSVLNLNTGGSGLRKPDFDEDREQAGNLVGFRDVSAFRLSSAIEKDIGENGLLSINPFIRSNELDFIAHWRLNTGRKQPSRSTGELVLDSQDAHINESGHDSIGALIKYRLHTSEKSTFTSGVDLEYTKGDVKQTYIVRADDGVDRFWLAYADAGLLYDFDVDFTAFSPYVQFEHELSDRLQVQVGLRYDNFQYDYDNNISNVFEDDPLTPDIDEGLHLRLDDTEVDLDHLSPKFSYTYALSENAVTYGALRRGFRVPTSGQLFRSGETEDSAEGLEPEIVNSLEFGVRGDANSKWAYEAAVYYLQGKDEIVRVVNQDTGSSRNENTGETKHYGLELGSTYQFSSTLRASFAYSYSKHKFVDREGFDGNELQLAPHDVANIQVAYEPDLLQGGQLVAEWAHQGEYFLDDENTETYAGHRLYNLRANYYVGLQFELYAKLFNVTDVKWAETVNEFGNFTPGRPRTAQFGMKYTF